MGAKANNVKIPGFGIILIAKDGIIIQAKGKIDSLYNEHDILNRHFSDIGFLKDSELDEIIKAYNLDQDSANIKLVKISLDKYNAFALPVYKDSKFISIMIVINDKETDGAPVNIFKNADNELEIINNILNQINSTLNIENVLEMIFNQLKNIFLFDGICIQLLTKENKIKTMKIFHNEASIEDLKEMENLEYDFEHANDSIKNVLTKGEYFVDSDTLYLPLIARDEIIGLLSVSYFENGLNLTTKQINSVKTYAGYISTALNNSYLYTEIEKINTQLKEKDEMISHDLKLAQKIQNKILVKDVKNIQAADFFIEYLPYLEVGGDYYDISTLDKDKQIVRIFLADATGHGIPAGLITMLLKSEYEKIKHLNQNPDQLLTNYNNEFTNNYFDLGVFCTCFLLDINLSEMKLKFCCAGHPPQLYLSKNKTRLLSTKGTMIGLYPEAKFELDEKKIENGDKILLFTDGIYEEFNQDDEMYGEDKLFDLIKSTADLKVEQIINECLKDVKSYMATEFFQDDVTFIGIQIK